MGDPRAPRRRSWRENKDKGGMPPCLGFCVLERTNGRELSAREERTFNIYIWHCKCRLNDNKVASRAVRRKKGWVGDYTELRRFVGKGSSLDAQEGEGKIAQRRNKISRTSLPINIHFSVEWTLCKSPMRRASS